jgi:hypothetical protein
MNPYRGFQSLKPNESIDYGVLVYRGDFPVSQAAALSRAQHANQLLAAGKPDQALLLAREAVAIDPNEIISQTTLGDIAAALGQALRRWFSSVLLFVTPHPARSRRGGNMICLCTRR